MRSISCASSSTKVQVRTGRVVRNPVGNGSYLAHDGPRALQHAGVALPFILLVITGFMVHYPDAGWGQLIRRIYPRAFDLRSLCTAPRASS